MTCEITYETNLRDVDWAEMKATLAGDDFDNGRTPGQLRASFEQSYASVVAYDGARIVGTARVLSDGVCNAYVVDVWTHTPYRRRGIARRMIETLEARLGGQHVYLFTDDAADFYRKLGFAEQPTGMSKVVGVWLRNDG
ncbi:MAG TPA: GNAT family N-acetyltransferase [Pyrinomonadaceae bacterium]|nr:GNAT family N-acetyltransferase [Pyrinomonadaceae bacterium]